MTRIALLHWKPEEAEQKLKMLGSAGFKASVHAPKDMGNVLAMAHGIDVILIDLCRNPLEGRSVAIAIRQRPASRNIPIVFIGGAAEKVEAIRKLLPDAGYIDWPGIPDALHQALRSAPAKPIVVDMMAGYSGTPLPKKLGIREGTAVALLNAPEGFETQLEPLPAGARFTAKAAEAQRIVLFSKSMKDFQKRWVSTTKAAPEGATLWIAWPKRASGIATDLSETNIRAYGLDNGWVDYKICAIDQTWSGLAFSRRKPAVAAAKKAAR
jgi:CheY-like chemotaxis protein